MINQRLREACEWLMADLADIGKDYCYEKKDLPTILAYLIERNYIRIEILNLDMIRDIFAHKSWER